MALEQHNPKPQADHRPLIGISTGDFNGVGPEIIWKTLADPRILKMCQPIVYGNYKVFAKYRKLHDWKEELAFHSIKHLGELHTRRVNLITSWEDEPEITPGQANATGGKYSFLSLKNATDDLIAGKIHALVTAPLNKAFIQSEEFQFPGHTEYLAERAGQGRALMFMCSDSMRVGLLTAHVPLQDVARFITKERIKEFCTRMMQSLQKDFGISKPRIAVLGLNPHAGEKGLLGKEEEEIIIPAIQELRAQGDLLQGPFPADGFFAAGLYKQFDGVLAMYHDQGLIPFKLLAFENGVNYTAGLPFIRTSPDHGTAYDLANKGGADPSSFRSALFLAIELAKKRFSLQD